MRSLSEVVGRNENDEGRMMVENRNRGGRKGGKARKRI